MLEQATRVCGFLKRVPQVRQPHQPKRMDNVLFAVNVERDPA